MLGPFDYSLYAMDDEGNSDGGGLTEPSVSGQSYLNEKRFLQSDF
jgi:hypothetical protein